MQRVPTGSAAVIGSLNRIIASMYLMMSEIFRLNGGHSGYIQELRFLESKYSKEIKLDEALQGSTRVFI